eukprot:3394858-Amphidinium_carterae.2
MTVERSLVEAIWLKACAQRWRTPKVSLHCATRAMSIVNVRTRVTITTQQASLNSTEDRHRCINERVSQVQRVDF